MSRKWGSICVLVLATVGTGHCEIIRLAVTTSTENSGLLDQLLPPFERETGIEVRVLAMGTGRALRLGRQGEVDAILVHDSVAEEELVRDGYGKRRLVVMHNWFVVAGPSEDPAGVWSAGGAPEAFSRIADGRFDFVSRGDDSGTHRRELGLWDRAGKRSAGGWYKEIGQGMAAALTIADELDAYTLTDLGTYLAHRNRLRIEVLLERDPALYNEYGFIAIDSARNLWVAEEEADRLGRWLLSERARRIISEYRIDGHQLFFPGKMR